MSCLEWHGKSQNRWLALGLIGLCGVLALSLAGLWAAQAAAAPPPPPDVAAPQQDDPTSTSTTTPTPAPTEEANLPDAAPTMEPFLQDDLTILSGNVQRPNGLYWYDDHLYTACAGDFTVYRIHDTTGETNVYIAGVQNAHSLYVDRDDEDVVSIWLADFQRNAFVRVQDDGPQLDTLVDELAAPWGLAAAEDGSFFMTQLRGDDVLRVQRDGSFEVVARGFRNPTGIAADGDYVYVANNGSARRAVEWFDMSTYDGDALPEEDLQPLIRGLQNPTSLVMGPDGLLYFAYSLGTRGVVGRVDPAVCREQGGCTNIDVEIVLWSELSAPLAGLTISDDMRLFVHTMFGSEIYWVQLPTDDTLAAQDGPAVE